MPDGYQYDAFISYCHHPTDRSWAKWLHKQLETYRTPRALRKRGVPQRLRRVFRDEDELAASTDLGVRIDEALKSSKFLVVVCSPRTPASRWVREEIERFIRMGRGGNILTLLVEGDPETAFPRPLLAGAAGQDQSPVSAEPLAADVRPQQGESPRRRRQNAALKLLAAIFGVEFDELRQREQERALRRMVVLVSGATVAAILFASLSVVAWSQRKEAIRRLGDSLLAQADGQRLLYRPRADRLYADAYDAYTAINADTRMAELAFNERLLSSPPPLAIFAGHDGGVTRVLFATDARTLFSTGKDGTLRRWDLATQTELASVHLDQSEIVDAALLPDGERLLYATANGTIGIADLPGGQVTRELAKGRAKISRVAVSPDGHAVAWGGEKGLLEIADLIEGKVKKLVAPEEAVTGLCFHPDGRLLISSTSEHAIRIWNVVDGRQLRTLDYGTLPYGDLALFPDGRGLLVGRTGLDLGAFVWDLTNDSSPPSISLNTHGAVNPGNEFLRLVRIGAVAVSPGSHFSPEHMGFQGEVAIGGEGGHIVLWDLDLQKDPRAVLIAHDDVVTSLAFSPDGQYLASSGSDGVVMLWNRSAFSRVAHAASGQGGFIRSTALSSDGSLVATGDDDGVVQVWDVTTRRLLRSLPAGKGITKVAFSPDDQEIVFDQVHEPVLRAWRFAGSDVATFKGHTDDVTDFAFAPALGHLASAGSDRTLRVWKPSTHQAERMFQLDRKVLVVSSLHRRPAVALATDSGDVLLYDLDRGRTVWSAHHAGKGIRSLAVLDNDKLIASGGDDGIIRIWDASNGRERFTLRGHGDSVTALAQYRGRWLFSSGWDTTLRVWDLETGTLVRSVLRGDMFGTSMALAPDGQFVAAAWNRFVNLWPLRTDPRWFRYRASLGNASKVLSRSKQDADALRVLGDWYVRCGDSRLAADVLERVSKAGGTVRASELAPLYWMNGSTEEATKSYNRALQAGEITQTFHDLRVNALSANTTKDEGNSDPPPPRLWASLWEFVRRSRVPDGSSPGAPIDKELARWADAHPGDQLTRLLRMAQQLFELRADPLQAMVPLAGVILPQVLTAESVTAELFQGGPAQNDGRLFQMTTVSAETPGELQIELSSKEFAPWLVVAEMGRGSPLEALGQITSPAIVRVNPQSGGGLLIMCSSVQPGKVGSFTLRIAHTR